MLSLVVGPSPGTPDAIPDLQLLLSDNGKFYEDWLKQPITQMVVKALDEASKGRAPQPGLQPTDYAQAVGEVVGMQRAVIAIRDPRAFLESLGTCVGKGLVPLPSQPSYVPVEVTAAPEPPPENKKGEKKEKKQ